MYPGQHQCVAFFSRCAVSGGAGRAACCGGAVDGSLFANAFYRIGYLVGGCRGRGRFRRGGQSVPRVEQCAGLLAGGATAGSGSARAGVPPFCGLALSRNVGTGHRRSSHPCRSDPDRLPPEGGGTPACGGGPGRTSAGNPAAAGIPASLKLFPPFGRLCRRFDVVGELAGEVEEGQPGNRRAGVVVQESDLDRSLVFIVVVEPDLPPPRIAG